MPPSFTDDQTAVQSIRQPLANGQCAAIWYAADPLSELPSVGGGAIAISAGAWPHSGGVTNRTVTLAAVAIGSNAVIDGTVDLELGLAFAE